MTVAVVTFAAGLVLLLVAGDQLVRAAAALGARLGLTPSTIGLTIVAAGTSAPELAVVFQSAANGDGELAVGSVIGSNIANVLLVLGLVAALGAVQLRSRIVRVDVPIMVIASVALLVLALDGRIGRLDGGLLVAALVAFVVWTLRAEVGASAPPPVADHRTDPSTDPGTDPSDGRAADDGEPSAEPAASPRARLLGRLVQLAVGIVVLAGGARLVVSGASDIATSLGVPELVIGLTVVALGTSAPEIVTSVAAAARGQRDLAVGNAIGSNIFNILLVLGAVGALGPGPLEISDDALALDLPILVAAAVACLPLVAWDHTLDRWEGVLFLGYYAAYLTFLTLDATGHRAEEAFGLIMGGFVMPLTLITAGVLVARGRAAARQHRAG